MVERMTSEEAKPRVEKRMALIDSQPPKIRALVHEHGWNVIKAFLDGGMTNPGRIKHCIHVVRHDLGTAIIPQQQNTTQEKT